MAGGRLCGTEPARILSICIPLPSLAIVGGDSTLSTATGVHNMGHTNHTVTPRDVGVCKRSLVVRAPAFWRWLTGRKTSDRKAVQKGIEATSGGPHRTRYIPSAWRSVDQVPLLS